MKKLVKGAGIFGGLMCILAVKTATAQNEYIQVNPTQAQTANFWITGLGKLGNGIVLPKEGSDAILLGLRFTNLAETRGANMQLTGGPNPGLATWIHDGTSWVERMRITATGYVGIGVNAQAPAKRLDIADTSTVVYSPIGTGALPYGGILQINNNSAVDGSGAHFLMTAVNASGYRNAAYIGITSNKGTAPAPDIVFGQRISGGAWGEAMRIRANGSVAIGTIDPGTSKLAVEGTITARRIKVTQATTWPDFVFDAEYKLPPLHEVEAYVKVNKHLPGVPSAVEVAKDGQDVGEMNKILLQKIEELTLHLIEQEKKIAAQQEQINLLIGKEAKN
ncbi:hypothetical protein [Chitinophaga filiformis]|uniref:Chaperone of endosialidase n=1 Tax=Chitinophaga filiformis TaxID=104663 RepID=A0ABY4IAB4_CHIFI|nr:hypothetical protein [Chitinophaga filiformis]UPK72822.1 hypothetical protein MYF79_16140 [Chitinophaga filiformis]